MQVKWLRRRNIAQEIRRLRLACAEANEATHHLTRHPDMGRPGRVPGTRELVLPHFPYIIPYRVKAQRVEILRVFHTSRKWPPSELA